jgi:hypothetical protein
LQQNYEIISAASFERQEVYGIETGAADNVAKQI